uniref:Uncharacterized protein n=1 Tax=Photinus pyralis TaxID=7054 RepID=A0A1Y1JTN3_PHOPY
MFINFIGQVEKMISVKWAPSQLIAIRARFMAFFITSARTSGDKFSHSCRILSLRASRVSGWFMYTRDVKKPHKKTGTVKSSDLAGQCKSPKREINCYAKK